jgi:hypothetical protein
VFMRRAGRDFEFHEIPKMSPNKLLHLHLFFPCFLVCNSAMLGVCVVPGLLLAPGRRRGAYARIIKSNPSITVINLPHK